MLVQREVGRERQANGTRRSNRACINDITIFVNEGRRRIFQLFGLRKKMKVILVN